MRNRLNTLLAFACFLTAGVAHAQMMTRPHLLWHTVETTHFIVHYPQELERWTLEVTERLESVYDAVSSFVGASPPTRITVIVEDPFNISNGFAVPDMDRPLIFLFPTPPTPQTLIGSHRGWGELLAVHEYAHIAHLTRPSRNPWQRRLWRVLPINLSPIARRSPRWITEGYATYAEGRLTGAGRPHGAGRPAVLRQWALEGQLPRYAELDATRDFMGGAMAYLAGSAYLEWLVERRGEESLQHLWRRMTARADRGFEEAFAGVYGGLPSELYGRFTAELTELAIRAERAMQGDAIVAGEQIQRLSHRTGDPALSPDGRYIALVLRQRDRPSRLVVWPTEPEPETEEQQRRRERALERDPEDVPAVEWRPTPRRAVATLHPDAGRAHDNPRFHPDGRRILVTRSEGTGDGATRPDLFMWDFESGELSRVTRGAAIRHADPAPDGLTAIADRCLAGVCDIVSVDLRTGHVTTILDGTPTRPYYRPRYSRDGRMVTAGHQRDGVWRVGLLDVATRAFREIGPEDGADRFDAAFMPDGQSVVVVSERGGVANLELIEIGSGAVRPLTRVTGAVLAPAPNPATGAVFFLNLHARGFDLHRIHPDSVEIAVPVVTDPALAPATQRHPPEPADTFTARPIETPRPYGLGPRVQRILPAVMLSPEGSGVTGAVIAADPVGRLTWVVQGTVGQRGLWRGGALGGTWRGMRPWLGGELFLAGQRPSAQQRPGVSLEDLDVDYGGALAMVTLPLDFLARSALLRAGGSVGRVEHALGADARRLAFADIGGSITFTRGTLGLSAGLDLSGSMGRTGGTSWSRGIGTVDLGVARRSTGLWTRLTHGSVSGDAPPFEQLVVGGNEPQLFDRALLSQRIAMPSLPLGMTAGTEVTTIRFALGKNEGPYYWMGRASGDDRWRRVWGSEVELDLPPISFFTLPEIRLRSGIAYSVDEPYRRRFSSHLALIYRP